jgi:hypothetical protein
VIDLRRQILIGLVMASLILLLSGCAALPDDWQEYPTMQPLPAVVLRLPASEVTRICGRGTMGCAERDYAHNVCVVRVDIKPLPDTIPHELYHCAGWNHGL